MRHCGMVQRTRPKNDLGQFTAKQYSRPSPPVLIRSFWLQPPSGPREGCAAFQDLTVGTVAGPLMSECPTMAAPWVLDVQFLQVRSSGPLNAVPSGCDPVRMSCLFGFSP